VNSLTLSLLILADNPLARVGLGVLLAGQPGLTTAGHSSGSALADDLDLYKPDVVICDWGWGNVPDRLAGAREAGVPVLALVEDATGAAEAWSGGARGLLPREAAAEAIAAAVTALSSGLVVMPPDYVTALTLVNPRTESDVEPLTAREREVLQLLAEGLPNKIIAARLKITDHTVKFHVNAIMTKLGVQSRTEAVVRASRLGLILL
jgi:two-component system, NarL family, nitrate/nitrite response regulator NarL